MTGVQPGLFGGRATLSILVACTLAMALVVRVVALLLVRQVVKIQRRKKGFRYRIPLGSAHLVKNQGRRNTRVFL